MASFSLNDLNPSQAVAAAARDQRIIVLAGAGTGKTKTATYWVASQIEFDHVPRQQIAMITFTRKAAEEMRRRVHELSPCPEGSRDLFAGTYHSFCSRLIRMDAKGFGLESASFSAIDDDDQLSLMRFVFKSLGDIPEGYTPAKALALRSYLVNTQKDIGKYLENQYEENLANVLKQAFAKYRRVKQRSNSLDYDDLLLTVLKRLREDSDYAERLRRRIPRVIVDEFQDNNPLNYAILRAWNPDILLVVGDQQQSIYRFRGSDPGLIGKFRSEFENVRLLKLEDNYRSGTPVLELANDVVREADAALSLKPALDRDSEVVGVQFSNDFAMAGFIAQSIQSRIAAGEEPPEISVLARSSSSLRLLELELSRARVPYRKYGGSAITDAAEVRDFLSVLRYAANPKDKSAAIRAMCLLPGVGKASAQKAVQLEEGEELIDEISLPAKAQELADWVKTIQSSLTMKEMGESLLKALEPILSQHYKKSTSPTFADRLKNLQTLVEFMGEQDGSLSDFLEIFTLDKGSERAHPKDAIILSTIHSAKGLEWNTVYLYGCDRASMPHPKAYSDDDFDEERRLMYVAVTRARSELMLCATAGEGGFVPSPYLPSTITWLPPHRLPVPGMPSSAAA